MRFDDVKRHLTITPKVWVVTGAAGFIGSHLVETLLGLNQKVIGLDNLATGKPENLAQLQNTLGPGRWRNFKWMEGDIQDVAACNEVASGADYVLHQAALGSVPRSVANPAETHASNVTGFLNILGAAKGKRVKRFVYASSSSVYGDVAALPQVEDKIGNALSPYAASKRINELYAGVFAKCYGMETIGLRYFNVFGPRQDPNGPYAAVIPRWVDALLQNEPVHINGDGSTSRDFCYVANVVQANLLAATVPARDAVNTVYNIAVGEETTLKELLQLLGQRLQEANPRVGELKPEYKDFQAGDVRHSRADISKARRLLGYEPTHRIGDGLDEALDWYVAAHERRRSTGSVSQPIISL